MNIKFIIKKHLQGDDYTGHAEVNDQLVSGIVGSGKTQDEALEEIKILFEARLLYGLSPSLKPTVSENRNIVCFVHEFELNLVPKSSASYPPTTDETYPKAISVTMENPDMPVNIEKPITTEDIYPEGYICGNLGNKEVRLFRVPSSDQEPKYIDSIQYTLPEEGQVIYITGRGYRITGLNLDGENISMNIKPII